MELAGLSKAELTRAAIVDVALAMAQEGGLESLTIGTVAERAGLSKSGVFSRVGSREELQVAVLKEYERRFVEAAVVPALREPRGLSRLRALLAGWARWIGSDTGRAGCLFVSGAVEYDDRPGPVRDAVLLGLGELRRHVARNVRQAVEAGQFAADTDPEQVAFELSAIVLGLHNDLRLFRDERAIGRAFVAFDRLLAGQAAH
ncbi:MAG: TetR/AcrR family transcriptional regulator [Burkholderiales bacterium]|jgi:AcrR family transcriptional regulator|nr:TetR/AcrR family transcriptional regulator [Burkholderiales bacterium]